MVSRAKVLQALACVLVSIAVLATGGTLQAAAMRTDSTTERAVATLQASAYEDVVAVASYNGEPGQAGARQAPEQLFILFVPWLDLDNTLYVQNTAGSPASIALTLYESAGPGSYTESTTLAAHSSLALKLETLAYLPSGFEGSAVLESDQSVAAVVNVQPSIGSLLSYKCSTVGATQVVLPEILSAYYGYNTDIWIQNLGTAPVDLNMAFYSGGGLVYTHEDSAIEVGRSRVYRTADMVGLPSSFYGWVLVTATEPVAVVSAKQNAVSFQAMASSGMALADASTTLVSPWQEKDTSFTGIVNPTVNAIQALASWYTPSGAVAWSESATVAALASFTFNTLSLPAEFNGSLTLNADQPVVGLANWSGATVDATGVASSPLVGLSSLTTVSRLPHVAHSESLGKSTELSVQNVGAAAADVTVTFYTPSGTETASASTTIEPGGSHRYATGEVAALGEEWEGSATIAAAEPIAVEAVQFLSKLVVDSTADSGNGTLREALSVADGGETITFDPAVFPPGSPATIALTSGPLPTIAQGGLTLDASNAGVILDGSALDSGHGLHITSNGNVVQGMQILRFPDDGIRLDGGACFNLIGGDTASERNVLSGNGGSGVGVHGTDTLSNRISGNYVGTDASGTVAIANSSHGISLGNGSRYTVIGGQNATPGGACTGECNVISGNTYQGVVLDYSDVISTTISGNYIGTDATGTIAVPNRGGVWIGHGARYNVVGGDRPLGEGNLLSGNTFDGVNIQRDGTAHNLVIGNDIGTNAAGTSALGNGARGVDITQGAQHNVVGSILNGETNVISGNGADGVYIEGVSTLYNTVTRNSIFGNGGPGIGLADGGNMELLAPAITADELATGTASGIACANCTVELFSDEEGEGRWFEGSAMADGSGAWSIDKGSAFHGPELTATATDVGGNTSQFGAHGTTWLSADVDLQGRTDDSGALFTTWTGGQEAGSCLSGEDGTCSIPVAGGTYSVTVAMGSYLDGAWESVTIGEGQTVLLPMVELLGGDVNDDCVVNILDLTRMGSRFGTECGDPMWDAATDINADCTLNILDLTVAGGNFLKACPVPWTGSLNHSPNAPSSPSPPDGAVSQNLDLDLSWTGGDLDGDSVTYDVYLAADDSTPSIMVCDDVTGTLCDPGTLNNNTHYYWEVVAEDQHEATTAGPVWEFTILLPGWYEVGSGSAGNGGVSDNDGDSTGPSVAFASDGTAYMAWTDSSSGNSEIYVMSWDGANWQEVGSGSASGGGISNSSGNSSQASIALAPDDTPYVAWNDDSSGHKDLYVRRWNGTAWEEVGSGSATGGGVTNTSCTSATTRNSIAVGADGVPYVIWDEDCGSPEIFVRRWNGTSWEAAGTGADSGPGISNTPSRYSYDPVIEISPDNIAYAVWHDDGNGNHDYDIYARRLISDTWEEIGAGSASGAGIISPPTDWSVFGTVAFAPDSTPYVAWRDESSGDYEAYIRRWNGTTWEEVGTGSATGGGISNNDGNSASAGLAVAPDGTPYVAWQDESSGDYEVYVRRWNGTTWEEVGTASASGGGISDNDGSCNGVTIAIDPQGIPYVAWGDDTSGDYEIYVLRWLE